MKAVLIACIALAGLPVATTPVPAEVTTGVGACQRDRVLRRA